MSHPPTRIARRTALSRRRIASRLTIFASLLIALVGMTPAVGQAAEATVTQSDLCRAWQTDPNAPEVTLASGYKITGSDLVRSGASCTADDASVAITNSAIAEVAPGSAGNAVSRLLAAAVQTASGEDDEVKVGDEVFAGASITSLTTELYNGWLGIRGGLEIAWSGGTVTKFQFEGRLYATDRFSMSLRSPDGEAGTVLPNVGGDPIAFKGDLVRDSGGYHLNLTGTAPSISFGTGDQQIALSNASLKLTVANVATGDGLKLSATGDIALGSAVKLTGGTIDAEFDHTGLLSIAGGGALDAKIPATASSAAGSITGDATVAYERGGAQSVTFNGAVRFGDALIANAHGTLDAQAASFDGDLTLTDADLKIAGDVDGVAFYGDDLDGRTITGRDGQQVAAQRGDFLIKSASASVTTRGLDVQGNVQVGNVDGTQWATASGDVALTFQLAGLPETTLKGSAEIDWVAGSAPTVGFKGSLESGSTSVASIEGTVDGHKLTFKGNGELSNPDLTINGAVDGVIYYADGSDDQLTTPSGAKVAAKKGDFVITSASASITTKGFALSGEASFARVGSDRWASGGGDVDLTLNDTTLKGHAEMTWVAGEVPAVTFSGSVKHGDTAVANATGSIDGRQLSIKGDASLQISGFTVKGAVEGTVFYGNDLAGLTVSDANGQQVAARKGDYLLKSLSADVTAQGLHVDGTVSLGNGGGTTWATANGSVDLDVMRVQASGTADLTWQQGQAPVVNFAGTLKTYGTTISGGGTIDGKKIAFHGDVILASVAIALEANVDGVFYYGDPAGDTLPDASGKQVPAQKGDYLLKTNAGGQAFVWNALLYGDITIAKVQDTLYAAGGGSLSVSKGDAKLSGDARFTWVEEQYPVLKFSGTVISGNSTVANASGTLDSRKVTFNGDATVNHEGNVLTGTAQGTLFYGLPSGRTIEGRDGKQAPAIRGDYILKVPSARLQTASATLTGEMSAGRTNGQTWLNAGGSIDVTFGNPATTIKGSANFVSDSNGSPALTFEGTVTTPTTVITGKGAMDGKKIALSGTATYRSSGLAVDGAVDGVVYYGDPAGDTLADATGKQVPAQKGDYLLKSASGSVTVQNLSLTGKVSLGKVAGGQYASGGGSVDLTSGTTRLQGSADFSWANNQPLAVTFTGSVTTNGTTIASASGSIDGRKLSLKGNVTIEQPSFSLSGAIDGVVYFGTPVAGDTITDRSGNTVAAHKGDFFLASASGALTAKNTTLSGNVSAGSIAGQMWANGGGAINLTFGAPATTIKGSGSFTWQTGNSGTLNFEGSVTQGDTVLAGSGSMDGKKLAFNGSLSSPTLSGNGSGVVYYGSDLSGETITNRAGQTVAASRGDFSISVTNGRAVLKQLTATADFTAKKVGPLAWADAAAQIKVGTSWLTFTGALDSTGTVNLKGSGSVVLDGYTVNFNGAAVVQNNALKLTGTADIITGLFSVRLSGTIEKPNMNSSTFSFIGSAGFRFGGYTVANATIRFMTGEGITTSFQVKTCLLFLCTTGTYKVYFTGQEISRIQLSAPIASWAAFFAIAKIAAPDVPVETNITGIL